MLWFGTTGMWGAGWSEDAGKDIGYIASADSAVLPQAAAARDGLRPRWAAFGRVGR